MSVNTTYYGDNWTTIVPVSTSDTHYQEYYDLGIKRTSFTTHAASSGYEIYEGCWGAKAVGGAYYQDLDASIAWCAMDKNAPQLKHQWSNVEQPSLANPNNGFKFGTQPGSNSPVYMSAVPLASSEGYVQWHGSSSTNIPSSSLPWNPKKGSFNPNVQTSSNIPNVRVTGWSQAPVVSFPFKNFILTPIITAAKFKTGKTAADLEAHSDSDYYGTINSDIFDGYVTVDLKTYMNSTTNNYENYPFVMRVAYISQVVLLDENNNITGQTAGGRRDRYPCISPRTILKDSMSFIQPDPYTAGGGPGEYEFNASLAAESMFAPGSGYYWIYSNSSATSGSFNEQVATHMLGAVGLSGYTSTTTSPYVFNLRVYASGDSKWHIKLTNQSSTSGVNPNYQTHYVYTVVDDNGDGDFTGDEFQEYVRRALAYYGMYFADGTYLTGETLTSSNIMLGIIDSSGVTHGEYSVGPDNADQRQADWNDPIEDTPYDPDRDSGNDDSPEDGGYEWTHGALNLPSTFAYINVQLATYNEVLALTNWFSMTTKGWDSIASVTIDEFRQHLYSMQANFQNTYPEECLKMIRLMPFNMPTKVTVTSTTPTPFTVGSTSTVAYDNHSGTQIPAATCLHVASASAVYEWTSEEFEVPTWYGDFRDYEPYTRIELQVPFCGSVNLDAAEFMGHNIRVEMQMDCIWGAVTAVILRDGQAYATLNGKIGVEVPFEVDAIGAFINTQMSNSFSAANAKLALNNATANTIQSGSKFIGKAVQSATALNAGSPISALGLNETAAAGVDLYRQEQNREMAHNNYEAAQATLEHTAMGRTMMGQGESATQFSQDYHIVLTVHRPRMIDYNPTIYGRTVGFACDKTGRVGSFSGYTEFANVILDEITATDDMKALILQRLQSGVII